MNINTPSYKGAAGCAAAIVLVLLVAALYFAPQFSGQTLMQHDVQQYEGMSKDILDNRAATGEDWVPGKRYRVRGFWVADAKTMCFDLNEGVQEDFRQNPENSDAK